MSERNEPRSEESLRHEYTEAVQNMRHYSNLRFAMFTIFFAVMGGVGFVAFGKDRFDEYTAVVARIAALPVILLFWLYEERAGICWDHCKKVAVNLERELGYNQFASWPVSTKFPPSSGVVNRLFFALLALLWLFAAFTVPLSR